MQNKIKFIYGIPTDKLVNKILESDKCELSKKYMIGLVSNRIVENTSTNKQSIDELYKMASSLYLESAVYSKFLGRKLTDEEVKLVYSAYVDYHISNNLSMDVPTIDMVNNTNIDSIMYFADLNNGAQVLSESMISTQMEAEISNYFKKMGIDVNVDWVSNDKINIIGIKPSDYDNANWVSGFNGVINSGGWDYNYPTDNGVITTFIKESNNDSVIVEFIDSLLNLDSAQDIKMKFLSGLENELSELDQDLYFEYISYFDGDVDLDAAINNLKSLKTAILSGVNDTEFITEKSTDVPMAVAKISQDYDNDSIQLLYGIIFGKLLPYNNYMKDEIITFIGENPNSEYVDVIMGNKRAYHDYDNIGITSKTFIGESKDTIKPEDLKIGELYVTDSGLGGVFTIKYKGVENGKHIFNVVNKGWEGEREYTDEQIADKIKYKITEVYGLDTLVDEFGDTIVDRLLESKDTGIIANINESCYAIYPDGDNYRLLNIK
jgi:hypothetical protein